MIDKIDEMRELRGREDGPASVILGGVHGDERCGVEAIEKLVSSLQIDRGRVFFGFGNPRAIEQNLRFTEANLNRMFKSDDLLSRAEKDSYEYRRAKFLKKYLDQADALLDIHASFTPNARAFIICESNAEAIAKYLPFDLVVSGFDDAQPGGTDYYMNRNGKIGMCVECGYLGDATSSRIAEESILVFLTARGHIKKAVPANEQSFIRIYRQYLTKTDAFMLSKPFEDFENVSRGQLIGTDGQKEVRAEKDGIILFARDRKKIGDEAFLLGENKNSRA